MLDLNFGGLWPGVVEYSKGSSTRIITSIISLLIVISIYRSRRGPRTPRLQGPHSESFFLGNANKIFPSGNLSLVYRDLEQAHGPVYQIAVGFGINHIVLNDLKALTHLFSKDTFTYCPPARQKDMGRKWLGDILVLTEGETHRRIRRVLSSALSVPTVRNFAPMCFDAAYQLKAAWDSHFQLSAKSNHAIVLDAEKWMSCFVMDNVGKAVLSHDFGSIRGHPCPMLDAIHAFHTVNPSGLYTRFFVFTREILYNLFKIALPNAREKQFGILGAYFGALTNEFLSKARKAPEDSAIHQSIFGVMLKSENENANIRLPLPEITAQGGLLLAGYETTAIALTWCFIELARRVEVQETLRAELKECLREGEGPTYDQLTKDLRYLDAFVSEILRLHPSETVLIREAAEDDVIPLTDPIRTASGAMIDSLFVKKGTVFRIPLGGVNISETLWGPDAATFDPNRWLDTDDHKKGRREKVPGYRNLLTFGAGQRLCPGRDLALLEMKAALVVLVLHFSFEFPNGPSTELGWQFGRPKVAGEDGPKVPLLVRKLT